MSEMDSRSTTQQEPVPKEDRHRVNEPLTKHPRAFILQRDVDDTGVSGVGVVAWGVEFPDGVCALRWTSQWPTSVVFHDKGMEGVLAVHGHDGKTRVLYPKVTRSDEMIVKTSEFAKVQELHEVASKILPDVTDRAAQERLANALLAFSELI